MYLLVAGFLASILALLYAAWAVRRSILRHGRERPRAALDLSQPEPPPGDADEH